jgi:hypothetical protein
MPSRQPHRQPIITDDEASTILSAALRAAGEAGQSKEELTQVINWAHDTRIDETALKLILNGEMGAFIRDGEMIWKTLP